MSEINKNKPGYKHTSLGWIPEEWEIKSFEEVGEIDKRSLNANIPEDYRFNYISLSDINSDIFEINTTEQIYGSAPSRARRIVRKGDILMSTVRPNLQGFTYIKNDVKDLIASTGFAVITPKFNNGGFIYQYLFGSSISKQFYELLVGSNYPAINSSDVRNLKIIFPTLPEQQKIAAILFTWDEAITKTQQLIAQLQQRNKGLMQQLLTGKKRLKGFEGTHWKFVPMNELFERVQRKSNEYNERIEVLTISGRFGFLSQKEKFNRVIAGSSLKNYTLLKNGEFAYNKGNSTAYQYGCVFRLDAYAEALVPNVYISFKPITEIETTFYCYYFKHDLLKPALAKIISSGARMDGLLNVNAGDFFKIKVPMPLLQEQKIIGNILEKSFNELKLYEQKVAALQQQKKGLMQKLLTGEVRVKI